MIKRETFIIAMSLITKHSTHTTELKGASV